MSARQALLFFLWLGGMPTAAGLYRVWIRQQNVSLGYVLHQHEARAQALRVEVRKLEVARAAGRTPRTLMALAQTLGLGPARPHQFVGAQAPPSPSPPPTRPPRPTSPAAPARTFGTATAPAGKNDHVQSK